MCNNTKEKFSVEATSTTTHLTPLNDAMNIASVKLHTTPKLPPTGKNIFFF